LTLAQKSRRPVLSDNNIRCDSYAGRDDVPSSSQAEENIKTNFVAHDDGPNPYTIEKKNMNGVSAEDAYCRRQFNGLQAREK